MHRLKFVAIGKILKTMGIQGHLLVDISDGAYDVIDDLKSIFLAIDGVKIPYFIEGIKENNAGLLLKLEAVDNPEQAAQLMGIEVFVTEDQLDMDAPTLYHKAEIIGYELYNTDEKVGLIEDVLEYPSQLMLEVQYDARKVLIPMVEDFVLKIDRKKKILQMALPEGLLTL